MSEETKHPILRTPVLAEDTEEAIKHAKEKVARYRKLIDEGWSVREAREMAGLIPLEEPAAPKARQRPPVRGT